MKQGTLPPTVRRAKVLRGKLTTPQVLLWQRLRGSPDGVHFRRQHPIGPYILDFFCHVASLAVEIDGIAHIMGDNPERDARRDAWLTTQGLRVLRLPASEVLRDVDQAAASIVATARAAAAHRQSDRLPAPKTGEVLRSTSWNT